MTFLASTGHLVSNHELSTSLSGNDPPFAADTLGEGSTWIGCFLHWVFQFYVSIYICYPNWGRSSSFVLESFFLQLVSERFHRRRTL